ncbi:hypothetical protein KFE98_02665 [bacterium SCSIO 12741]|nr:hypothetical protein KFE98_02665 [bacterium SCSIO 12741]
MKTILALFLSVILVASQMGITFATHYCGGKAVKASISIGMEDLSCGMNLQKSSCENHPFSSTTLSKKCCENQYLQLGIEDSYKTSSQEVLPEQLKWVAAFVISYINLYLYTNSAEVAYLNYLPPLLDLDIPVLIQSFLL